MERISGGGRAYPLLMSERRGKDTQAGRQAGRQAGGWAGMQAASKGHKHVTRSKACALKGDGCIR